MDPTPNEVTHLIDRLRAGDLQALGELFQDYRERLRRMVELRMDARLRTRLDASDVLQEAYLDLAGDLDLNTLDPIDREVLALKHFEELSRAETAEVLGISAEAAAKRYFRALKRLKEVLASMPGGSGGI
jgi:DNA-directed RNA polymerase specialized sigma24 family protein